MTTVNPIVQEFKSTRQSVWRRTASLFAGVASCALLSLAGMPPVQAQPVPLTAAADVGLVPFFMRTPSGTIDGFSNDMMAEVAKRLGRSKAEIIDTPFSAIFAGLFSSRYDMIAAPTNITKERAAQMLFTEPYMAGGISFLVKKGNKIEKLEDLKGKLIGVNNGSFSDKWLQQNQEKYGYEIQRFNKNADAVQAVVIGRAYANLSETPQARWIAKQTPMLEAAYHHKTGSNYGLVFRKTDVELRNQVEQIIECMKTDGTLAKLHEEWFGVPPDEGTSMAVVFPGFGAPGFDGHDPTEHKLVCKK